MLIEAIRADGGAFPPITGDMTAMRGAHGQPAANPADRLATGPWGEAADCFERGMACAAGTAGAQVDLVEAHKWFNLAAIAGHEDAKACRGEVAEEMTAREIAEAQRRARAWLMAQRKAA